MWEKNKNIRDSSHWLSRKIELIELKDEHRLKNTSAQVLRGGVFNVELGSDNIGGEKNKTRPCLIISKSSMNGGDTIIVIPLSSKFKTKYENGKVKPYYNHHYILRKSVYSFLSRDSCVKTEDIRSIDKVRVNELLGNIDSKDMEAIKSRLMSALGY